MNIQFSILFKYVTYVLFLLGVNENRWLHNSQNSFLEYLSHCNKQSWCIYLMEPVQMQGWNNCRSIVASQRHTRQMSPKCQIQKKKILSINFHLICHKFYLLPWSAWFKPSSVTLSVLGEALESIFSTLYLL